MVEMKKRNWKIGLGCLACLTFVGLPVGIPLIMLGIWDNYVDYKNQKEREMTQIGMVSCKKR